MKHIRTITELFTVLTFIVITITAAAATSRGISITSPQGKELYLYKDYHALVVGVSNYEKWPKLPNAVRDAREVSAALRGLGFTVSEVLNPTSQELKKAVNDLTYRLGREKNRAILLYFAGHGETETLADGTKLGYIIPKDCPLIKDDPQGFINHALSMKDIEAYSLRIRSKHLLVLFDSCFSGSLFSLSRAIPEDISEKSAFPVRQFITAGNENETVPDRSMFKRCLLVGLQGDADLTGDGYITGSELGMYLADKVVQYTSRAQHPQYGKINIPELSRGDFIIKLASSGAAFEKPAAAQGKTTLSVTSNVSGATVVVDNRTIRTPVTDLELSPGEYWIRVEKDGYDAYQKRIRLKEGRSLSVTAYLDRAQPQTGSLSVDTVPDNARVRILNITPKYTSGMELTPGRYHLEVSAPGYETTKEWIDLAAGEDKYVDIRLTERWKTVAEQVKVIDKTLTNSIGMKFALIQPGTFTMGSPWNEPERNSDETPHRVTLTRGFHMGATEVTVGQWRLFIKDTGYRTEAETGGGAYVWTGSQWEKQSGAYWDYPGFRQTGDHPVTCVSWNDVKKFIAWLNRKERTERYRLPTEAEWEYACRAGTTTPFSTGGCISTDQANYNGNYPMPGCSKGRYRQETVRVGSFSPNPWGLYDMHGNVWEWCRDWYGDYPTGSVTDPTGPSSGTFCVLRGGSWLGGAGSLRAAGRSRDHPDSRYYNNGFRVARDL